MKRRTKRVKNKILSFLKSLVFFFVTLSLMASLYILNAEVGLNSAFLKYKNTLLGQNTSKPEIEKETNFLKDVLNGYYKIEQNSSLSDKVSFLNKNFDASLVSKHEIKLKSGLSHFYENGGSQNYSLEKISYNQDSKNYVVNLKVNQVSKNEKPYDFDVDLSIEIKKIDKLNFVISSWEETILPIPYEISLEYNLSQTSPLSLSFPCRVANLTAKNKNSKIEYKVLSDYMTVVFNTMDDNFENTGFIVNCEKTKFEVSLSPSASQSVIYAALAIANGKPAQKLLTPQEKMTLSIRKQLRSWGLVEEKQ